ncbi:MAG: LytTR family DNA-binding domain-containing protein [Thermoflavifilum sp.]|nr:LytTR family DNA-binding domain-containing protein [Thermoflavifilum sp.]
MINRIKTLIVDDEQESIDILKAMMQLHVPEVDVVAETRNVQEAVEAICRYSPMLVMLDIEMPYVNGFGLFQYFQQPNFDVIFVTAYESYALKAIKFNALDYILKPYSPAELKNAIQRFLHKHQAAHPTENHLQTFVHNLQQQHQAQKIALPIARGFQFVEVKQIIRCEAMGSYTRLYFTHQQPLVVCRTLKEFEFLLEDYQFFRIHQSHLINCHHIHQFVKSVHPVVVMSDGVEIEVARRRLQDFIDRVLGGLFR